MNQCGLCGDDIGIDDLDLHVNRSHRMMSDRYHALVGGFAEAGKRAAALEAERDAIREMVGALDNESTVDAVRDMATEWEHYSKAMSKAGYVTIPNLEAHLAACQVSLAQMREALGNLQNVVADADSIGEMQGEDKLMEPWSSLAAHAEKYLDILSEPADERGRRVLEAGDALAEYVERMVGNSPSLNPVYREHALMFVSRWRARGAERGADDGGAG